jgi:hypothetical protein
VTASVGRRLWLAATRMPQKTISKGFQSLGDHLTCSREHTPEKYYRMEDEASIDLSQAFDTFKEVVASGESAATLGNRAMCPM